MRNPEAVQSTYHADTGYTTICPTCNKRSGFSKIGPRFLTLEICAVHRGEVKKTKRKAGSSKVRDIVAIATGEDAHRGASV